MNIHFSTYLFSFFLLINTISFPLYSQEIAKEISESSPKALYFEGIQNYQKKDYRTAFENFKKALIKSPNHKDTLYNFGLSAEKLKKDGLAIGAWRKALHIDPYFDQARSMLEKVLQRISKKQNLVQFEGLIYSANNKYLNKINFHISMFLTLLFAFFFSFNFIRYMALRKRAYLENERLPTLNFKKISILILFVLSLSMTLGKSFYVFKDRATLVEKSAFLKSAPSNESSTLFEVYEGQHMILIQENDSWMQVEMPMGLKGWLLKTQLFQDGEASLW